MQIIQGILEPNQPTRILQRTSSDTEAQSSNWVPSSREQEELNSGSRESERTVKTSGKKPIKDKPKRLSDYKPDELRQMMPEQLRVLESREKKALKKLPVPTQLVGHARVDAWGSSLCYNYNLGKCPESGPYCPKGRHDCMRKYCVALARANPFRYKQHPLTECGQVLEKGAQGLEFCEQFTHTGVCVKTNCKLLHYCNQLHCNAAHAGSAHFDELLKRLAKSR
jgi:hypothetical protein